MARAGAKAQTRPLDLSDLPKAGGERVVAFVERYCRITKGPEAGTLLRLRPWQQEIVHSLFDDGPRPRRAYLQLPRKNGKSALAAALALYALLGDGEQGGEVYSVAGSLEQAAISWHLARRMVELSPELRAAVQIFGGAGTYYASKLYDPDSDSIFRPLAASAGTLHGLNPHFVLFDEVHNQPNDLVWEAVSLAMGFRATPLLLAVTTPGHDEASLAHQLFEYGRSNPEDRSFYFRAFEPAAEDADWRDEAAWAEANPALGDFLSIEDLRSAVKTTPEHAFRKFRLGQWTKGAEAWIGGDAWDACADAGAGLQIGESIVVGFDGSLGEDSTALVGVSTEAPHRVEILGIWERTGVAGYRVPRHEVNERVEQIFADYKVTALLCDPPYWAQEIAEWARRFGPTRVLEFPTYSRQRMAPAATTFSTAVHERRLLHTGDPILRRHVLNCVVHHSPVGDYPTKPDKDSPRKIDAAIAAVIAVAWAATNKPRGRPRVY